MPLGPLSEPRSLIIRFAGTIKGVVTILFFMSTLLGFNLFQVGTCVIGLFSQKTFRALNRWSANTWWGWCVSWAQKLYGLNVITTGDDVPKGELAIVIANHQGFSDIPVIFTLARTKDRLGDLKWFVKDTIKYFPGIGWGMLFLDCLFIKRDWTTDSDYIHVVFKKILDNKIPLWLITFVEGTRTNPMKIEAAIKFALEKNLTPLNHVLIPRTKGFVATVEGLRGHVDAVYDLTIGYVDGLPTMWQWLKGYVSRVHLHVRRYDIKDLPHKPEKLAGWLYVKFEEKDALLEHFYCQGAFPLTGESPDLSP